MYKDKRHRLIWDFQREIIQVYQDYNLTNLAGLDREFILNGRNIQLWYYETISRIEKRNSEFNFNRCFEDLIFCSDEILFFTALLYLYQPYLQNPIDDGFTIGSKMVYPYTQTIEVSRFNMFTNSVYEKVYNYWDRIGDLIAASFPDLFSSKKIYFTTVIDGFPEKFKDFENFKWLKGFRENEFKILNKKRKDIVHSELIGTFFRWEHATNSTEKEVVEKLVYERQKLPEYFKGHIDLTKTGFEKTIQLLNDISIKNEE